MNTTVRCKSFGYPDPDSLTEYCENRGMTFSSGIENATLCFELAQKPEILDRIAVAVGDAGPDHQWDVMQADERGILLYVAHPEAGDCYVFIPDRNIIAIHTADHDFVRRCCRSVAPAVTS